MSTNETQIELPAVVTYADLVDAQEAYVEGGDSRARLNAIAARLGLVDREARPTNLQRVTGEVPQSLK